MPAQNLTRQEAQQRAATVKVQDYDIALDLALGSATFGTTSTVRFSATPGSSTFVDFLGPSVESVVLNDLPLDPVACVTGARILLTGLAADNVLTVRATGAYMNSGEGLHRFVDPVDGEVYLYTQFEVADARRVFAVFEQPDLKASYRFSVTAPAYWRVLSNESPGEPVPAGARSRAAALGPGPGEDPAADARTDAPIELARWDFPPTPPLSSYLTAIVAGPYVGRTSSAVTPTAIVPLGVYCRRSLESFLEAEELFDITRRGLAHFEDAFGTPLPFPKYDQVFCPEYNLGAMENAGCVTINEVYVFRARVTDALRERRALTVLHELAHMWFGDLVTMRWWDDLWLNESFAEWASTDCMAAATRWTSSWTTFASESKAWAYSQDQLSTTHPIAAVIDGIDDVQENFDGITYAKGAAVLKQLVAYVGADAFTAGLRSYFRRHAWGNTTLADLLAELEATSGRDLERWSRLWLENAGVNTLVAHVETGPDGLVRTAVLEQTAPVEHPTLRPHRIAIGSYERSGAELVRRDRFEIDVEGPVTALPQLAGVPRPDVLLINDDDLGYTKVRFDADTLAALLADPGMAMPSLPRSLALGALWDMTRDAELSGRVFVRAALAALPQVSDSTLTRVVLGQIQTTVALYVDPHVRATVRAATVAALRGIVERAAPGSDAQLQLVTAYAALATAPEDIAHLQALLEGTTSLPGLSVDTEMRWTLLTALAAGGVADEGRIIAERDRDATSTGRERAARALAARPTPAAKEAAWRDALDRHDLSNQMIDAVWQGFGRVHDVALLAPFVERYHAALLPVWSSRTHAIAESIIDGFYPSQLADARLLATTQDWLDAHTDAPGSLVRLVSENRDIVRRALSAQERDRLAPPDNDERTP